MQTLKATQQVHITKVKEAMTGSKDACGWLYRQYCTAMFNICLRMAGEKDTAQDLLQEAFITAFGQLAQLKDAASFGGWLKQITIRKCIHHSKSKYVFHELDDNRDWKEEDDFVWWEDISMQDIQAAIKTLPDGCRQVFNLYAVEDYSHRDIAGLLQITESTSKSQYHRAKDLLRKKLTSLLKVNGQF